ncbi:MULTISPECIES: alkaline phosphatase family protein [unclassified Bacillus (in: firmicutes)]|uniref:alkaline phosphatase family protein n=1 Tax=unclassified Bacillus (in: firmicutes) TaxID=185979 RepID=UPI0008E8A1CD|nr:MULTISPECIES: alkaline phosphatase family protein [unclassified Bacillus (in: firmicutes)]SFB16867.1 Sulfatase [Bacillus sp. UNCCL13]SFQ77803.1 Sulfatase [Bacillus sp. cl95]
MKKASAFEKTAARCWNLLNEGKPFTPIFVIGTMVIYQLPNMTDLSFVLNMLLGLLIIVPLLALYFIYDFPLFLRNYLWIPFIAYLMIWDSVNYGLLFTSLGLYFFFTVFFWGTIYYHLRIGTTWLNFRRFWKLVLKNSDSTSGNAQEQLPKFLLILSVWNMVMEKPALASNDLGIITVFYAGILLFAYILHKNLFDWKPKVIPTYTENAEVPKKPINDRVIVMVIDGMRKERFEEANTPFLDKLKNEGTDYSRMETVYPARTVVCFSSMFTGTYPHEHGIKSNMVWKLGIKVESIFDSLRKIGKKGSLLGIAHLVDSFGKDVETVTAVMHNDVADRNIIERAKLIMKEQNPDLQIVQLIGTDQTGHSRGVFYDDYIQKIEEADALVEEYYNWLKENNKLENFTFIVCADHGQADGIGGHGHLDEGERYVPFFMYGPSIEKGKKIDEKRSLVSMASTIAYLMGAPYPSHSRGPVLLEALRKDEN